MTPISNEEIKLAPTHYPTVSNPFSSQNISLLLPVPPTLNVPTPVTKEDQEAAEKAKIHVVYKHRNVDDSEALF